MIVLYQYVPAYGLPNASPFCMKVENYLRMTGLDYRSEDGLDLPGSPKGKLPYIRDGGVVMGDSGLIIDYLKATYGDPLDGRLSATERAVTLAFVRLIDEHMYWAGGIQPRWVEDAGWRVTRTAFFSGMTGPLRYIVPLVARFNLRRQMWGHGMARHTSAEIYAMACADITALAGYLDDKPFFQGERPTSLDAAAYAFIANIVAPPIDSPAKRHALTFPNLAAYCRRLRQVCYGDEPA